VRCVARTRASSAAGPPPASHPKLLPRPRPLPAPWLRPGCALLTPPAAPPAAAACGCAGLDAFLNTEKGQVSSLLSPSMTYMMTIKSTGHLVIMNVATGEETFCIGPFKGCAPPYKLNLQPNGNLVFSGKNGKIFWSSQTACLGTPCYTYKLHDSGEFQVRPAGRGGRGRGEAAGRRSGGGPAACTGARPATAAPRAGRSPAAPPPPPLSRRCWTPPTSSSGAA
jgi:hypothetical protein